MESYQQLFALTKNSKYVKMCLPENRAAIRIEQYCKRRKDRKRPKWQEDSSCVFAYFFSRHLPSPRYRRKRKSAEINSAQIRKKKFCKSRQDDTAGKSSRERQAPAPVCRSQSAAPAMRGIVYSQIRRRADHRTSAEPSAAEFSGLVSAVAHTSRGQRPPYRSVLTWHK